MKIIHYSEAEPKRFDADTVKGVTGRLGFAQKQLRRIGAQIWFRFG